MYYYRLEKYPTLKNLIIEKNKSRLLIQPGFRDIEIWCRLTF